jgi:formyltetrahydrofolate deformylase
MTISAILLISAPDKKGLVYAITRFIYEHQGNLLHAEQHIDDENTLFFMRIEWDLASFDLQRDSILPALEPIRREWGMDLTLSFSDVQPRVALFVSKQDHCIADLLYRVHHNDLNIMIPLIISNHPDHETLARFYGIDYLHMPVLPDNKNDVEREQLRLLEERGINLVVLARYMQILSSNFVSRFPNQIINVHHSFLPAFVGADPYAQAFARGVKLIGSTAHFVTQILDDGPIIAQQVIRVSHKDSLASFTQKGKELEKQVLAEAVKKYAEHKILVFKNQTVVFD